MQARANRQLLVSPGQIDVHARDLTACAAADVKLIDLQKSLSQHEQWFPIDGPTDATLGELIEKNSTGPLRLGYGAWRDLLLGCQFINGQGQMISAGGRTMKNVAGYDLTKFMVGQRGRFGRLVTITVRTYRRPAGAILASFPPDIALVNNLIPTDLRPQWMLLNSHSLFCGYLGDKITLEFIEQRLPSLNPQSIVRRTVDEDSADRQQRWTCKTRQRISLAPSRVLSFVHENEMTDWIADPAFGVLLAPSTFAFAKDENPVKSKLLNDLEHAFASNAEAAKQ